MNNLFYILATVNWTSLTNYFVNNPFRAALEPFSNIIGFDLIVTWILLTIGGALYLSEHNMAQVVAYFMIVLLFLSAALNSLVLMIFGIIAALITTSMLHKALVVKFQR